ncbi:MAG TPA: LegC family aminotransferase [Legionella sp.]|nr:LegC family aminotransferase [Legionella sp.]
MFKSLLQFVRDQYQTHDFIPLHAPVFTGQERQYVLGAIDSTFVSSVGGYVDRFERDMAAYTGSAGAVVTVNGTSALHMALLLAGVRDGDYVITQTLTFVATCNAIAYCHAKPIFLDVDRQRLSLSPVLMDAWLQEHAYVDDDGLCRYRADHRVIRACLPMHTFGHPADLDGLIDVSHRWGLQLVEDAAESLGSLYKGRHTGTLGSFGILSFNGNKIITTGGGGMILTSAEQAVRAKHLTTTAKKPHAYAYCHDEIGFNYRMPNLNAAMGCAQLEQLDTFIANKRLLAQRYAQFFKSSPMQFVTEPVDGVSNYWLNAVVCEDSQQRDALLDATNKAGVMTRPVWEPMHHLPMFHQAPTGPLENTEWLTARLVNLPSSVVPGDVHA